MTSPIAEAVLGDLARVIIAVMIVSLIVSLVFIPRFSLSMNRRDKKKKNVIVRYFNAVIDKILNTYILTLDYFLKKPKRQNIFLALMFILCLFSVWLCVEKLPRIIYQNLALILS